MTTADLTLITKIALGLAIAGFFVSFTSYSSSNINGTLTCEFTDYGKIVLGSLAIMAGGLGELSAFRMARARIPNLLISGGATVAGLFHLLVGVGAIGGPC